MIPFCRFWVELSSRKSGFITCHAFSFYQYPENRDGLDRCWPVFPILIESKRWYLDNHYGDSDINNKIGRPFSLQIEFANYTDP